MKKINELMGIAIKVKRTNLNLTQEELAYKSKIDRAYLSEIENGHRSISLEVMFKLASALKVKPSVLVNEIENDVKIVDLEDEYEGR